MIGAPGSANTSQRRIHLTKTIFALIAALILPTAALCATESEQARAVVDTNKEAIVTIELVIEQTTTYEGETEKDERSRTSTGIVIDPSGLVVTSLVSVNPADAFSGMMDEGEGVSTVIKDLKVKLDDGTEVAYDMVLRDPDLDLAFMKPKKELAKPLKAIDMSQGGSPQIMDRLVLLSRLGAIASRSVAGMMCDVQAVVSKPRAFYVLGKVSTTNGIGCPAFTLEGKPAGVLVLRASKSGTSDDSPMPDIIPIVLPCSDIAKAAEQAKTAKPVVAEKKVEKTVEKKAAKPAK